MLKDTITLNAKQKEAVEYNDGPLLIIAGAGTGKTSVIVEKIRHLVNKKLAAPSEILALTFTEKAAGEMEERVDRALPYGYFQTEIHTFHAFADQLLRHNISHIGLSANYRLMTEAETVIFLRENLFLFNLKYFRPLGNPNKFISAFIQHFSRLRDEDAAPDDYLSLAKRKQKIKSLTTEEKQKILELANAYKTYQSLKVKADVFDFADLIFYTNKLLKARPHILRDLQKKYKYILVDEFQDTNIAQYALLKLLCPPASTTHLTVVGDDSQAIYKFRGASVSNIITFMRDYKSARSITLTTNYRSVQPILDHAYRLIRHNDPDTLEAQLGISKNLNYFKKEKLQDAQPVQFFLGENAGSEADYVARQILDLKKVGYSWSDMALLVRANNHADIFKGTFARHGIPYQFWGPGALYKQPEVKDLIAYLTFLSEIDDSVSLYRVLTMDILGLSAVDVAALLSFARSTNLTLFQAMKIAVAENDKELEAEEYKSYKSHLPQVTKKSINSLRKIYIMITHHLDNMRRATAGQILYYFLDATGYLKRLATYKTETEEKVALNVSAFFNRLKNYENEHEDSTVGAIVDYLKMSMELGESPRVGTDDIATYDAVHILTVHGAKGLEFPIVFLPHLVADRFPTRRRNDVLPIPEELIKETLPTGDYHILEERRLFYVGVTRAKRKLYLTAAEFYGEGIRRKKLSPFVEETLGSVNMARYLSIKHESEAQIPLFEYKEKESPIIKKHTLQSVFSYTQIETFDNCPLQYKYRYILRIPVAPKGQASFGITIHAALEKFYKEYVINKKLGIKRLIEIYREEWIPLGYASATHQNRMKKEGEKMLRKFFATYHDPKNSPLDMERDFKIKISSDITVVGKIDRVDRHGEMLEIIDYKTGKTPDLKKLEKSLQLSLYLLAASGPQMYETPIDKITLTFYYLQEGTKFSMKKKESDLETVRTKITETVGKIRSGAYPARVGPQCNFCSFRMICEAWQ